MSQRVFNLDPGTVLSEICICSVLISIGSIAVMDLPPDVIEKLKSSCGFW